MRKNDLQWDSRTRAIYTSYLFALLWMKGDLKKLGSIDLHLRLGTHDHLPHSSFFQFGGFLCSFQHVSCVFHGFLQWSHHDFSPCLKFLLSTSAFGHFFMKVELSVSRLVFGSCFCSMTLWRDSSLLISKNISRRLGRGFHPRVRPRASSNSLLRLARNRYTLSTSFIFIYRILSVGESHSSS